MGKSANWGNFGENRGQNHQKRKNGNRPPARAGRVWTEERTRPKPGSVSDNTRLSDTA